MDETGCEVAVAGNSPADPGLRLQDDDPTSSMEYSPPRLLRLRARAWPGGEAEVLLEVNPSQAGCTVTMSEDAVAGPELLIPGPLRSVLLTPRNRESLRRLAFLAERRKTDPPQVQG